MDIVERLRDYETKDIDLLFLKNNAALEIEKLRWENANMEKLWGNSEGTWMEIRDKQDAEIKRLREALQKIADWPDYRLPSHQEIARDALKEKENV